MFYVPCLFFLLTSLSRIAFLWPEVCIFSTFPFWWFFCGHMSQFLFLWTYLYFVFPLNIFSLDTEFQSTSFTLLPYWWYTSLHGFWLQCCGWELLSHWQSSYLTSLPDLRFVFAFKPLHFRYCLSVNLTLMCMGVADLWWQNLWLSMWDLWWPRNYIMLCIWC